VCPFDGRRDWGCLIRKLKLWWVTSERMDRWVSCGGTTLTSFCTSKIFIRPKCSSLLLSFTLINLEV
jgi:hypothetical protein